MKRVSVLPRALVLGVVSWLMFVGCAGGSGGGCLQPIPTGRYAGPKTSNAVNIRLSDDGISYFNTNFQVLLNQFAPGGTIHVPVACSYTNVSVIGDMRIADQGKAGCTGESCGQMDGRCCGGSVPGEIGCSNANTDLPADVKVDLTGFKLTAIPPDKIEGDIDLTIATGKIYVDTSGAVGSAPDRSHGACFYQSPVKASVDFNTSSSSPNYNTIKATVQFKIDTKWDELLSFKVTKLDGTQICGASGAPAKPVCLDASDVNLSGENTCGDAYITAVNWDPVKNFLLQQISPLLQTKIQDMIKAQSFQACSSDADCPQIGTTAASRCDSSNKYCVDSATGAGVPRFLGIEGRVAPGALLGGFGVPAESQLDLSIAAGSSVKVDTGISIGTRAGMQAVTVADCVPALPAPLPETVSAPNFDAVSSTKIAGYHVGIGISKPFLNMAMYQAHQSGAICISLNSSTVGVMNTGLFKTFLPSLGRIATRDGKDAPMMVVLKPAKAPEMRVGEGTYDPVTKKPVKPLLLITLPELTIDFYAMIDDRYARLFSLTADISLPLSLIFEGCSSVTPAIGDLKQLVSNISTSNSEMLAEDPKVLADLIPAVIGLAEPALASALKPFALPAIAGFKLQVLDATGVNPIAGTDWFDHLGIYAKMVNPNAQCAVSAPLTKARVKSLQLPKAEQMRLTGHGLPWPSVTVSVESLGKYGTAEYAYRIDDGMWSTFLAPTAPGELTISDPNFLIQGTQKIELRSRNAEDPFGISAPVTVNARIDWEPPEVSLSIDRAVGRIDVKARDVITSADRLEYAYKVGDGALSNWGAPRIIDLAAVEAQGGVEVYVRDESGNVGMAVHRAAGTALRPEAAQVGPTENEKAAGCEATGGLFTILSVLGAGLLRRRKK
ncbi:MAG: hypothetical protein ACJ790_18035 [Myxococcaceae bacterium]